MSATIWGAFCLAALTLILLRLRPTLKADLKDPITLTFTIGLFFGAFGTLTKQFFIAQIIDSAFGPNAAWVVADSLFLIGLTAGTLWVDLMRNPQNRESSAGLFRHRRIAALLLTVGWMITAAILQAPIWGTLERGGINVGGNLIILTARLAYLAFDIWALSYLSYHFYRQRQHMRDRFNYIRLTIPWVGITLAAAAPIIQLAAIIPAYVNPTHILPLWPALSLLISATQGLVALLIIATFFPPAYRLVSWADKQVVLWHLSQVHAHIAHIRPDLNLTHSPAPQRWPVRDADRWLTTLVNDIDMTRALLGVDTDNLEVPAGAVMSYLDRYALHETQAEFMRGLQSQKLTAPTAPLKGDTHALARWYSRLIKL